MNKWSTGLAIAFAAGFSLAAQAQTMNFESFDLDGLGEEEVCGGGPGSPSEVEENGLVLTPFEEEWCLFNEEVQMEPGLNGNGSNFFGFCGSCELPFVFELVRSDGQPFSLVSIDFGSLNDEQGQGGEGPPIGGFSTTFVLRGFPAGGGAPVERSFEYEPGPLQTFAVSGLDDMQRVEIVFPDPGPDSAYDNIVTRVGAGGGPVAIPAAGPAGLLALMALMLLMGWRRLRETVSAGK